MSNIKEKSPAILCTLLILQKYSSEQNPLSNNRIISYLEKDYGISISPNTLRKHIASLTTLGFSFSTFEDNGKGVYLIPPEPEYDDSEIKVLIDSVLTSRYIPARQAKELIQKLTKLGSKAFPKHLTYIEPVDDWNHRDNKDFFWNLTCLTDAIHENKMVSFCYNKISVKGELVPKNRPETIVHPLAVVCSSGQYYLLCRFSRARSIFHYRIDRMTKVKAIDVPSSDQIRQSLNLARYCTEHHFMYGGKIVPIVLKMPAALAGDIVDRFGKAAHMVDIEDGMMEVHLHATEESIRYFAMQYGASGCEVLRPTSLREQIRKDIKALLKKYEP